MDFHVHAVKEEIAEVSQPLPQKHIQEEMAAPLPHEHIKARNAEPTMDFTVLVMGGKRRR